MSSKNAMRKFGRGYVLDFNALKDEFRNGNQQQSPDHATTITTPKTPSSGDSTSSWPITSPTTTPSDAESNSESSPRQDDKTPSPSEEEPSTGEKRMQRMPSRMSVSRTGRCKNRDRQRVSVLQTTDFYRVEPSLTVAAAAAAVNNKDIGDHHKPTDHHSASVIITSKTDVVPADANASATATIQSPMIADCYSF